MSSRTLTAQRPGPILVAVNLPVGSVNIVSDPDTTTAELTIRATTDSDDYTTEVAAALAEAVRTLNYATGPHVGQGLTFPQTVYTVTGHLGAAAAGLGQLFGQLTAFLTARAAAERLADAYGTHPDLVVARAGGSLDLACSAAADLARSLCDAQNAVAGLYVPDTGEREG